MQQNSAKYSAGDGEGDVLSNLLGITDQKVLDQVEARALIHAYEHALVAYSDTHQFTSNDVSDLHRLFLGEVFSWGGEYRSVDLSSESIRWCHATHIPSEMERYSKMLKELTPFRKDLPRSEIVERAARIHGDLVLIHPFRDGNGRTTRMLGNLIFAQAGYTPIQQIAFYDRGVRPRYQEGQEDQLGALGLVLNASVLWQTLYMDQALRSLRSKGEEPRSEDVARLSPLVHANLNVLGHYSFSLSPEVARGEFRPLKRIERKT